MFRRGNDSRLTNETDDQEESESNLRVGLARLGLIGLKAMAWLVAAVLGLEWFTAREGPTDDMAMRLLYGEPGVGSKSLKVSPDGMSFATTDTSGHVGLWHTNDEWAHTTHFTYGGYARTTTFSPDGRYLVSGGSCLTLWDLKNGGEERKLPVPVKSINAVEFSPDGRTLALGTQCDRGVVLWDLDERRMETTSLKNDYPALSLAFSPDGRSLAAGDCSDNAAITVWDLGTRMHTLRLRWPRGPVKALIFSPDSKSLATASCYEGSVRLWDVRSGNLLRSFAGHPLGTNSIAFSPDGSLLATGGNDGLLRLWTVATGELKTTRDAQSIGLLNVAFLPGGHSLAAAGYGDNNIRIWDLSLIAPGHQNWNSGHSSSSPPAFMSNL